MRAFGCADKFIKFQLNCFSISILCVLNQKDHQKRDDRCAGVDNQLPGVTEAEYRPGDDPHYNDANSKDEHFWPTAEARCFLCKPGVPSGDTHAGPLYRPVEHHQEAVRKQMYLKGTRGFEIPENVTAPLPQAAIAALRLLRHSQGRSSAGVVGGFLDLSDSMGCYVYVFSASDGAVRPGKMQ